MINKNLPQAINWRAISDYHELVDIQEKWLNLASQHADGLFSSPAWLFPWIDTYWQKEWHLHVIIGEVDNQLVVFAPFYCQIATTFPYLKTLYPLGQGEPESAEVASEYQDILMLKPTLEQYQQLALQIERIKYDILNWRAVSEKTNLLTLCNLLKKSSRDLIGKRYLIDKGLSPAFNLSKNNRNKWNKFRRLLDEKMATCTWVESDQYDSYWEKLTQLHQSRWQTQGRAGAFTDSTFTAFHQKFRTSTTVKVSALIMNKEVIAINYYLVFDKTLYFYQSGWHQDFAAYSPGFALHQWSINNNNFNQYDFMMGGKDSSYKSKYGCNQISNMYSVRQVNNLIKYLFDKITRKIIQ